MKADLINRFIDAAVSVLQAETGEPVSIGPICAHKTPYISEQITVLIGLTGSVQGIVLFGFSDRAAGLLVSRMIGQEMEGSDELIHSGIAEVGNVIAGTAVTAISSNGHNCTITPPSVIIGGGSTVSTVSIPRLVIPLVTSCGALEMQLALKINGAGVADD